jgi:uncharacterized protein YrrD
VPPTFVEKKKENIPEGTLALEEGARVVSLDDKHVGNVEQVLTQSQTDRATHIVISAGLLFKHRKLIPSAWTLDITPEEVRLSVDSKFLEQLPEYQPQPG